MKKFTSVIFMFLMVCCLMLTGCSTTPLKMPDGDYISSNGGFIVGVGNYSYYANAFENYSNLTTKSDNNGSNVAQRSLRRTQVAELNEHNYVLNISKNEEGAIVSENVANKIAGYETSNIYIVGKYMYFTSPNVHKNKENSYEFNLSTLFRIKLDGTGITEVYTTEAENAKFYLTGGENQSILIFDNATIKVVNASAGSKEIKKLVDDVESVVFPKVLEKDIVNLYYTVAREEGETGNILKSVNLKTQETKEYTNYTVNGETLTLVAYDNDRLFYTRTGGDYDALYSNDFSNGLSSQKLHRYVIEGLTNDNFAYIKNDENGANCFVFAYGDKLYLQDMTDSTGTAVIEITSDKATIKYISQSYIIYTTESGIYKYSVKDRTSPKQVSDLENFNADYIDYDGKYVYFFAKVDGSKTETYYLHRANTLSSSIETECIAELLEEDITEEAESEE